MDLEQKKKAAEGAAQAAAGAARAARTAWAAAEAAHIDIVKLAEQAIREECNG